MGSGRYSRLQGQLRMAWSLTLKPRMPPTRRPARGACSGTAWATEAPAAAGVHGHRGCILCVPRKAAGTSTEDTPSSPQGGCREHEEKTTNQLPRTDRKPWTSRRP